MAGQVVTASAAPALTALDTSRSALSASPPPPTNTQPPTTSTSSSHAFSVDVQSPSSSTPSARARFEFEHGCGNEGTKVLMVEWEDDNVTRRVRGRWHINWDGKPAEVMPVEDDEVGPASQHAQTDSTVADAVEDEAYYSTTTTPSTAHSDASAIAKQQTSHRLLFLLGPRKHVPATVTLTLVPDAIAADGAKQAAIEWKTNPLPAIYPRSLADPSITKSSKGVLHGLWAQKRLAKLEKEIEEEAQSNCEGIALHMAVSEKEWIENNYGLVKPNSKALAVNTDTTDFHTGAQSRDASHIPQTPSSPLSPGGSRLSEKLKGLKLQVSESAKSPSSLSPQPHVAASLVPQQPRAVPIMPSKHVLASQNSTGPSTLNSIGAMLSSPQQQTRVATESSARAETEAEEDELFALPLSPRSPEMTKSPFSFAAEDTKRYLQRSNVGSESVES